MKNIKKLSLLAIAIVMAFMGGLTYYATLDRLELIKHEKPIPFEAYWSVSWRGRYGEFSMDVTSEQAVFLTESEAIAFKESVAKAFELLRITGSENNVTITKHLNNQPNE